MSPDSPWIPFVGQMILAIIGGVFTWIVARKNAKIDIELRKFEKTFPKRFEACEEIWSHVQKVNEAISKSMVEKGLASMGAKLSGKSLSEYCVSQFSAISTELSQLNKLANERSLYLDSSVQKEIQEIYEQGFNEAIVLLEGKPFDSHGIARMEGLRVRIMGLESLLKTEMDR